MTLLIKNLPILNKELCYVVNIHDPLNLDIDLGKNFTNNNKDLIYGSYQYEEDGKSFNGNIFKCRLKGIVLKNNKKDNNRIFRKAFIDIIRIIDRQNGWVHCDLYGIDKYGRLLIDIFDPITGEYINDIFLQDLYNEHFKKFNITSEI